MASRTKSFFEQENGSNKSKFFPRNRFPNNRGVLAETSVNAPQPKAAFPPSAETKNKLKTFQFVSSQETVKPNATVVAVNLEEDVDIGANSRPIASTMDGSEHSHGSSTITPQLRHANTFPCTPNARLPLEELIGNCDATKKALPAEETPEEQIKWLPNSSANHVTPNHKRKRARSSSPTCPLTCSQQQSHAQGGLADQPSAEKVTPEADPAADLWRRYANGRPVDDLADLAIMAMEGSPRPLLETPVRSGGFRRWVSTGNDWPKSRNKRLCTSTRANINLWQDQTVVEVGGKSKVAAMVQKIQESLSTQSLEKARQEDEGEEKADAPSSSSPLPETKTHQHTEGSGFSPLPKQQTLDRPLQKPPGMSALLSTKNASIVQRSTDGDRSDVVFPAHRQQVLDPNLPGSAPLHFQNKVALPAYKRPSITRVPSQPRVQPVAVPKLVKTTAIPSDEFGDEFDLTVDDLDEIMGDVPVNSKLPPQGSGQPQIAHNATQESIRKPIILDDDDEFGGSDIDEDDFAQAEICATQAARMPPERNETMSSSHPIPSQSPQHVHIQRYVVKKVVPGKFTNERGRSSEEVVLLVEAEGQPRPVAVTLRGSWTLTPISPGNIIHIANAPQSEPVERSFPSGQALIDDSNSSPFLIVHPDQMLSATTVADSFDCIRKAVLQNLIKATGETSKAMVYGSILHEIFQQALSANTWDEAFLDTTVRETVQAHVEGLWELGMRDLSLAIEEIKAKMNEVSGWADKFISARPADDSLVDGRQGEKVWMSISKLIAIEEHVWSPLYGLKGNIDATVETVLVENPNEPAKKLVVPFEVKTGRTTQSPAHRAQTALYTLLLSDRYNVSVTAGILYYLESASMSRIAPPIVEVRQMIQQRNRLATYISQARYPAQEASVEQLLPSSQLDQVSNLPTLLKNPFKCSRCYAQTSCFTYHALKEGGNAETAGMLDDNKKNHSLVWQEAVGHLLTSTKADRGRPEVLKSWFTKWDRLLTFEEGDQLRMKKELWTMPSSERQKVGRCFGNLVLKGTSLLSSATATTQDKTDIDDIGGKINRYAYSFVRHESSRAGPFTEGTQLVVGEPVVISSEQGQWALANGYVVALSKDQITVAVDRKLGKARQRLQDFDEHANQAFRGIMTVGARHGQSSPEALLHQPELYRLDKDEFSNGLALIRNNLLTLMSPHPLHAKLREQIVFGEPPTFSSSQKCTQHLDSSEMNEDQCAAVRKVLTANDYALILGMPGTGKTTTIAQIIKALLAENKSILLTSFTHTAVDNILQKIRHIAPEKSILRLGVPAKINAEVQQFCLLAASNPPRTTIDEVEDAYMNSKIVATTCMGTNHAIFRRRTFDVCIVDEASQITLPTILGPLLCARKFVLVGDHFQLPPLVQNRKALEGGLDESLFRMLCEREESKTALVELGYQYRMCEDIMALSNQLIYHGKLRCGSDQVAHRSLRLEQPDGLDTLHSRLASSCGFATGNCWLSSMTDPTKKVVLVDTDLMGPATREVLNDGTKNITNPGEAALCTEMVLALLAQGVKARDIGIITPYRSQLALIRRLIRTTTRSSAGETASMSSALSAVEVDTPDRFQGRDKEITILSMVRSNVRGEVGELLRDSRRINVAITRARSKLVLLGSRGTLERGSELLKGMITIISDGQQDPGAGMGVLQLPATALESHEGLGFGSQQLVLAQHMLSPSAATKPRRASTTSPVKRSLAATAVAAQSPRSPMPLSPRSPNKAPAKEKIGSPTKLTPLKRRLDSERSVALTPAEHPRTRRASPKIVKRSAGQLGGKMKKLKEAVAVEIWEDLTAEDLSDF